MNGSADRLICGPPGRSLSEQLPTPVVDSHHNRSAGTHWSPKVVSFLTESDSAIRLFDEDRHDPVACD
jgi:hypothetical protein